MFTQEKRSCLTEDLSLSLLPLSLFLPPSNSILFHLHLPLLLPPSSFPSPPSASSLLCPFSVMKEAADTSLHLFSRVPPSSRPLLLPKFTAAFSFLLLQLSDCSCCLTSRITRHAASSHPAPEAESYNLKYLARLRRVLRSSCINFGSISSLIERVREREGCRLPQTDRTSLCRCNNIATSRMPQQKSPFPAVEFRPNAPFD